MSSAKAAAVGAFLAAVAAGVFLGFFATNTSVRCDPQGCVTSHPKVIDESAVLFLVFLPSLIPVALLALMQLRAPSMLKLALPVLFFGFCLISILSVGILYVPAALLTWLAAVLDPQRKPQPT